MEQLPVQGLSSGPEIVVLRETADSPIGPSDGGGIGDSRALSTPRTWYVSRLGHWDARYQNRPVRVPDECEKAYCQANDFPRSHDPIVADSEEDRKAEEQ